MRADGAEQPAACVIRVDIRDGRQQVSLKGWHMCQTTWHHITKTVFVTLYIACLECIMPYQLALVA